MTRGWLFSCLLASALVGPVCASPARAATSGDFSLGVNSEKQSCRAVERFDGPRGGAAVDIYCGQWEKPSGWLVLGPADARQAVLGRLAQSCKGAETVLPSTEFSDLRQVACGAPEGGRPAGPRRFGVVAQRGSKVMAGAAYPADWGPLLAAARVLSGAAARTAAAASDTGQTPGLREIEAAYPQGVPGQGAEFNYELLRRRAFERNVTWNFASSERDFETLLQAHDTVSPEDGEGRAEILAEIGLNLSNGRRFGEAARDFARAETLAKAAGARALVGKIANYRALDDLNQRNFAAARDLALAANQMRAAPAGAAGGAAISAADARAVDHATPRARRDLLLQLEDTTDDERAAILSAQGFYIAGVAARALHDPDAERYLAEASSELLRTPSPPAWLSAAIFNEEAQLRLAAGDAAGADARARTGLTQVRLVAPQTREEAHLLLTLAEAQSGLGRTSDALESDRAAMRIFSHQLEEPGLPADVAGGPLRLLLRQWSATQDPALAGEYFETLALTWDGAAARSAAQLAARLALRGAGDQARSYQDAERGYRAALARRQRLALDIASPAAEVGQADAAVADTARRFAAAEADLRDLAPGYLELLNPSVVARDVQSVLPDKEGYLRIVMAADGGFGALVTNAGIRPFAIAMTRRRVDELVARIRRTTAFRGRRLPAYDIDAAAELYAGVIGPVAGDLAALERLQVDVSGSLASAPIAALVESRPQGEVARKVADADYSQVAWFARRLAIANALGPASFVRFRKSQAARPAGARGIVAFGDFHPAPDEAAARIVAAHGLPENCQADVAHVLASLGPLPDTAEEARDVTQTFGGAAQLRLGAAFTDTAFLDDPAVTTAQVILIATHGVLGLSPCFAEPALLTSVGPTGEGLIEASRVLDRKLAARLVILSACDTAGGGALDLGRTGLADGGEALSGLARGFLYAGASDVMATEWKIDSATSAAEVTAFLATASKPGAVLTEALAAAERTLYNSPETGHPFYWAAFILVGDGDASIAAPATEVHAGP